MPRKKELPQDQGIPADLQKIADDESQDDLRDPEDAAAQMLINRDLDSLKQAFQLIANTNEGAAMLRHIMRLSGYQSPLALPGPMGLDQFGTIYNVARRDLWIEIRPLLTALQLATIENPLEVTHG